MRFKKEIFVLLLCIFSLSIINSMPGSGTEGDPYQITNWTDLHNIENNYSAYYILMNNLNSSTSDYDTMAGPSANGGEGWDPIGVFGGSNFDGNFNGQNNSIDDMYINSSDESFQGLFLVLHDSTFITNLGMDNCSIYSNNGSLGCLTGEVVSMVSAGVNDIVLSKISITNSKIDGGSSSSDEEGGPSSDVGGIIGTGGYFNITDSYAQVNVTGNNVVGGFIGNIKHNFYVDNSYSAGEVTGGNCDWVRTGDVSTSGANSFCDTTLSGESCDGMTCKTTSEMKSIETYNDTSTTGLDSAWDITTHSDYSNEMWFIKDGVDYPDFGFNYIEEEVNHPPESPTLNSPSEGEVITTDSVLINITVSDSDGDNMNISFRDNSDSSLICQNNSVSTNSNVLCTWDNLDYGTHEFYVEVFDGSDITTSDIWNFSYPTNILIELINPTNGVTGFSLNPSLKVNFSNDEGSLMNVSFYNVGWNLSNVFYTSQFSGTQGGAYVSGVYFKHDGSRFYHSEDNTGMIFQYDCSDKWNASNCSYNNINLSTPSINSMDVFFSKDGSKLYEATLAGDGDDSFIRQYSCSSPWELNSCSYNNINLSTNSESGDLFPTDIYFKPDGNKFYLSTYGNIREYLCSSPWELDTCSYNERSISTLDNTAPSAIWFKGDGNIFFLVEYGLKRIFQYSCSSPWDLDSCSYDNVNFSTSVFSDGNPTGIYTKKEGDFIYIPTTSTDLIYQLEISPSLIYSQEDISNESQVSYDWRDRDEFTTYYWFANVSAYSNQNESIYWNFTTGELSLSGGSINSPSPSEENPIEEDEPLIISDPENEVEWSVIPREDYTGTTKWSIDEEGNGYYELLIAQGTSRSETLEFQNLGNRSLVLSLNCAGEFCRYVSFEDDEFNLSKSRKIIKKDFTISLPENVEKGEYYFNILAIDSYGNVGTIKVKVIVSDLGLLFYFFYKLFNMFLLGIPFWILALLIYPLIGSLFNYLIIDEVPGHTGISIIISLFLGSFLILIL